MLTESLNEDMFSELEKVKNEYILLRDKYGTNPAKNEIGEWDKPTIGFKIIYCISRIINFLWSN